MRVKKQTYKGLPAIALYMHDETVKIRDKLNRLSLKEKQ
jgi:hypothetical protein